LSITGAASSRKKLWKTKPIRVARSPASLVVARPGDVAALDRDGARARPVERPHQV